MKKYFNTLRNCPLFQGIHDENLTPFLACLGARVLSYEKKEPVFSDGDPAGEIGIVLSGSVQMNRIDYNGNRCIISNAEVSDMFAESFACAGIPSMPVAVIANEPSKIMLIPSERVMKTCENGCGFHRQMIFNLMKNMARKNVAIHQKMEITSRRTTREKLLTYLTLEAQRAGEDVFTIPYDRQELADYLQVDRSGLSVEISKLKKEGIVKNHKNEFELLHI